MATSKIEKYQMAWNAGRNEGMLVLLMEDGHTVNQPIDSAEEGMFLVDLLRNEEPVFYDAASDVILTGFEPVGEGEHAAMEEAEA